MVSTYINGEIKSEIEVLNTSIFSNSDESYIGRRWDLDRSDNNRYTWDGYLDDIAISSRYPSQVYRLLSDRSRSQRLPI